MRIHVVVALLAFSAAIHASSTLRVGSQVLTTGDSALRVTELLGKPSYKSRRHDSRGSARHGRRARVVVNGASGEQWQYRRGRHVTIVTIVDGKVSDIEENRP